MLTSARQTVFGWTNTHLHQFEIGTERYGSPGPLRGMDDLADESRAKLFRLLGEGDRLDYTYDFGDDWVHRVTVEKVIAAEPATRYPSCSAGRRACPPKDVGGPWGYVDFLAALQDPGHEEHEQWSEWIGGGFDPEEFDLAATDAAWNRSPGPGAPFGRCANELISGP